MMDEAELSNYCYNRKKVKKIRIVYQWEENVDRGGGNLFADDSGGFICFSPTATPATSNSNIIAVSATAAHTEEPHHPAVAAAAAQSSYSQRGNIFIARWNITLQTWKVKKKKNNQPTNTAGSWTSPRKEIEKIFFFTGKSHTSWIYIMHLPCYY